MSRSTAITGAELAARVAAAEAERGRKAAAAHRWVDAAAAFKLAAFCASEAARAAEAVSS